MYFHFRHHGAPFLLLGKSRAVDATVEDESKKVSSVLSFLGANTIIGINSIRRAMTTQVVSRRAMGRSIFGSSSCDRPRVAPQSGRKYRVVALDIDGILQKNGKLLEKDASFIRKLHERGIVVIITSERSECDISSCIQHINLPEPIPVVCQGGSLGTLFRLVKTDSKHKSVTHHALFEEPVSMDTVKAAVKLANRKGHMSLYFHDGSIYANPKLSSHYRYAETYRKDTGIELVLVGDDFMSLLKQPNCLPSKLQIVNRRVDSFDAEKFSSKLGESANVIRGFNRCVGGWYIEIRHANAAKGKGLQKLCSILRLLPSDTCAIGYKKTEIDYIQAAGFGISLWKNEKHSTMKALKALDQNGALWSK